MIKHRAARPLALGLVLLGATSQAAGSEASPYFGARAGFDNVDAEFDAGFDRVDSLSATGVGFDGYLGVHRDYGHSMFALEGNIGYSDAHGEAATTLLDVEAEARQSYGVSTWYGPKFGDAVVYARFGWQWTHLETTARGTTDEDIFDGPRVGVGAEFELHPSIALRLDWSRTFYEQKGDFLPAESALRVGFTFEL